MQYDYAREHREEKVIIQVSMRSSDRHAMTAVKRRLREKKVQYLAS